MSKKRSTRRRRRGSLGPLLRVLSVLLAAGAIVAALTLFFKVGEVEVTGNVRYTAEEIVAVTGVEQGDNLILLDKYHVAQKLYTQLPYITNVRINRKLPDGLEVEVTETAAAAAVRGAGSWWLLSSGGKLLEPVETKAAQEYMQIKGLETQNPAAGGRLELLEDCAISTERLEELLGLMEAKGMLAMTDSISVTDPDKLVIGYDDRFKVELYYDADFDFKLTCLQSVVSELEPNETGTIRMTMADDNEIRFIPDA